MVTAESGMPRPADPRVKIELLRAAEAVFVEHGLTAAKVEDITTRAGVSKGAFYLHFGTKEDCFRHIVEAFLAKLASCVDVAPPSGPAMSPESFAAQGESWLSHDTNLLEFCWQNRGLMKLMLVGGGGERFTYLVDEFAERMSAHAEDWARHLIASGIYRTGVDPALVPALISGAYERLVRKLIAQPRKPDVAAWALQLQQVLTLGLCTEEARAVLDRGVSNEGAAARRARTR
jgi:AcrR family transcriptional regulator